MNNPRRSRRESSLVSHISPKTSEIPRISCKRMEQDPRVRLSLRKGAWRSGSPRNLTGNRGYGADTAFETNASARGTRYGADTAFETNASTRGTRYGADTAFETNASTRGTRYGADTAFETNASTRG